MNSGDAWDLVPGDALAVYKPHLLRPTENPTRLQHEERMYYEACSRCHRRINVIQREGCECPDGPREAERQEALARHRDALAAVEAARRELAGVVEVEEELHPEPAPEPTPIVTPEVDEKRSCIVAGCESEGRNKLGVRCRVWHDGPYRDGKGKTAALWAPDTEAFLCDEHALSGATITLLYEANDSGTTAVRVVPVGREGLRTTPIKGSSNAGEDDGEGPAD